MSRPVSCPIVLMRGHMEQIVANIRLFLYKSTALVNPREFVNDSSMPGSWFEFKRTGAISEENGDLCRKAGGEPTRGWPLVLRFRWSMSIWTHKTSTETVADAVIVASFESVPVTVNV